MKTLFLFCALVVSTINLTYSQCACCAAAGACSSNGDNSSGVLTLSKKQVVVEAFGEYRTIQNGSAPEEDEKLLKNMTIGSLGIRYGLSDKITISALLPYIFLHTNYGDDKGIGDLIVSGTFDVYSKNYFSLAFKAGVKLPTGVQKSSNFDNTTVVVGSGSYDPIASILFSKRWNKIAMQGSVLYKYATPGFRNNYYGSLSTQNVSLSYRIKGESIVCSSDSLKMKTATDFGWSVFGGYTGEWSDKLKEDDVADDNSGGYTGFINLGTNFSLEKWSLPITVSFPIINKMNGLQNPQGVRFRIGLVRTF